LHARECRLERTTIVVDEFGAARTSRGGPLGASCAVVTVITLVASPTPTLVRAATCSSYEENFSRPGNVARRSAAICAPRGVRVRPQKGPTQPNIG
jgi:hypothetical protein